MANVVDYVRGERIDPVTGKPIKRVTTGAVPTDFADMLLPVASGEPGYFAPGFGSNLVEDVDYFDEAPRAPTPQARGPNLSGNINAQGGGRGVDKNADTKARAGSINDFGSWVDAVMAGSSIVGGGGPLTTAGHIAAGTIDPTDSFGNANMEDRAGWDDAVAQAEGEAIAGVTTPEQTIARANQIYADKHPGWGQDPVGSATGLDGFGGISTAPSGGYMSTDEDAEAAFNEGIGDVTGGFTVDPTAFSGDVKTASGSKPGGSEGDGAQQARDASVRADTQAKANAGPTGMRGTPGMNNGRGPGGGRAGEGGRPGGGPGGRSADPRGHEGGGYRAMAEGGYVTNMPASVRPRREEQRGPANEAPVKTDGSARMSTPPAKANPPSRAAFTGMPTSAQRFAKPLSKGFEAGGFVPKAGYQEGGAVAPNSGGPQDPARQDPSLIPVDNQVDNQPIMADEREFVINRESADILGPEVMNAINDPEMALLLSDIIEDAIAMKSSMGAGTPPAAPTMGAGEPPMAGPGGGPGAGASQGGMPQQRTAGVAPSSYRKGGYVTGRRGSLGAVRA